MSFGLGDEFLPSACAMGVKGISRYGAGICDACGQTGSLELPVLVNGCCGRRMCRAVGGVKGLMVSNCLSWEAGWLRNQRVSKGVVDAVIGSHKINPCPPCRLTLVCGSICKRCGTEL